MPASASAEVLFILDEEGRLSYLNDWAAYAWGRSRNDLLGRSFTACFPEIEGSEAQQYIAQAVRSGKAVDFQTICPVIKASIEAQATPLPQGVLIRFHKVEQDAFAQEFSKPWLEQLLRSLTIGVFAVDAQGRILRYNAAASAMWGTVPRDGSRLTGWIKLYHPDGRAMAADETPMTRVLRTGKPVRDAEVMFIRPDGSRSVVLVNPAPIINERSEMVGVVNCMVDITERKRSEMMLRSLADAGTLLAQATDCQATLTSVARLLVPHWADWCSIELIDAEDGLKNVAVAHVDAAKVELARELRRKYPPSKVKPYGAYQVIRSGEPQCFSDITDEMLCDAAEDEEHLRILRELGLRSGVIVPLAVRDETFGVLTLMMAEGSRRFTEHDLPHVMELARRCALAVDNARLHEQMQHELSQRTLAEQRLQKLNETLEQNVARRTAEAQARSRQLQRVTMQLTHAEHRERRKLAHLLHDDQQQLLVAARMRAELLKQAEGTSLERQVDQVVDLINQAIDSSRSLSHELAPPVLYSHGLAAALEWLVTRKKKMYDLTLHVQASDDVDPCEEDKRVLLFQCVRELLLNVVKHAGTKEVWIRCRRVDGTAIEIVVEDHGKGFDLSALRVTAETAGLGLFAMRERMTFLAGELAIDSAPGEGTRVTIRLPQAAAGRTGASGTSDTGAAVSNR